MTTFDLYLIGQIVLNAVIVVQHIRLKKSAEREFTMLHYRLRDLGR